VGRNHRRVVELDATPLGSKPRQGLRMTASSARRESVPTCTAPLLYAQVRHTTTVFDFETDMHVIQKRHRAVTAGGEA
jgi:hypothetical protein